MGARLATTQRAFTAKVTLNIEDTPGMQWICLARGHHHLHLLLDTVVEEQDASATRRGGRLPAQYPPGGALDPGRRPRGKTLPGDTEI